MATGHRLYRNVITTGLVKLFSQLSGLGGFVTVKKTGFFDFDSIVSGKTSQRVFFFLVGNFFSVLKGIFLVKPHQPWFFSCRSVFSRFDFTCFVFVLYGIGRLSGT